MINKNIIIVYIALIIFHILHIIEETIGKAFFISTIYSNNNIFLIFNFISLIIPLILFLSILQKNKVGYNLSYFYAIIMILDGLYHIINKIAGIYSGTGLIIFGALLIYTLHENKLKKIKK